MEVSGSGFTSYKATGINLNVNDNLSEDAKLQVGGSSTEVEVSANNVQVETSDTQLKTTFEAQQIKDLPLLGRDVVQLQKTTPGVVESSDRFGTFSTNGTQTAGNSYLLDGADINDAPLQSPGVTPNPDALGEFQITTSTIDPQYSRNSGAILLETLKTGTNSFHGNGFEFYRDSAFTDAPNYFSQGVVPPLHQNVYGGTLGGPILKDKLFLFLAYQGIRNSTSTTTETKVFSADQLAGNFAADGATFSNNVIPSSIKIPNCLAPGETWSACLTANGGVIPSSSFSAISNKLVKQFVPAPNTGAGSPYYEFNALNSLANDQGIIRADYHLTSKDTLWASSIFQSSPSTASLPFDGATLPGVTEIDAAHTKIFNASYTHIFNSSTVNELRANYFRFNYHAVDPETVQSPTTYGFNITPQNTTSESLPTISVGDGYFTLGFSPYGPQPRNDQTIVLTDNLSKVIGSHNLRFGFSGHRYTVDNPFFSRNNGAYSFNVNSAFGSGDPALDFLLGVPSTYLQGSGALIDARAWEYYGYAQDNWKATQSLTFNYGLGYDVETPFENLQYGKEGITCWTNSSYQSTVFAGLPGLKYPGDPGCNANGGPTTKYGHVAPRVGFAWAPTSGPKFLGGGSGQSLSIRGGFGVYYNRDQEEGALQNLEDPPFGLTSQGFTGNAASGVDSPSFANPFVGVNSGASIANPFPATFPSPSSHASVANYSYLQLNNIQQTNTIPVIYNFNINIERSIATKLIAQIGYVGSLGHHLVLTTEDDPITAAGHAACLADNTPGTGCNVSGFVGQHANFPGHALQPATNATGDPYYLTVGTQETGGDSNYNSFQAQLRMIPSHHISFNLSYTYSHGLDDGSGLESAGFNGRGYNYVPGFQYLNYGDSDYDARHRFVALYTLEVPIGQYLTSHLITREALGGWSVSGITTLQTGFPINITDTGAFNSEWCDEYSYYSCPDTPNTTSFKPQTKLQNPTSSNGGFYYLNSINNGVAAPNGNGTLSGAFYQETQGTFGNVKRGFVHGPGFNYTNMDIFKNFYFSENRARYIEIRVESYNVFNHPNFANPDGNLTDGSSFGQITSVVQPGINGDPQPARAVQFGGKIYF